MKFVRMFVWSMPISLIWMGVTGYVTPGGFLVGLVIGMVTLIALRLLGVGFDKPLHIGQPVALLTYAGLILWNGLLSSFQVAKLVLSPKIHLRTGIVALPTGDTSEDAQLTALSAHGINMTPGQLVIDFDENNTLYIHCFDLEASRGRLEPEQARRLSLLKRMMGVEDK
jgi:multicomponent Na+:H+ antiporter subunit E